MRPCTEHRTSPIWAHNEVTKQAGIKIDYRTCYWFHLFGTPSLLAGSFLPFFVYVYFFFSLSWTKRKVPDHGCPISYRSGNRRSYFQTWNCILLDSIDVEDISRWTTMTTSKCISFNFCVRSWFSRGPFLLSFCSVDAASFRGSRTFLFQPRDVMQSRVFLRFVGWNSRVNVKRNTYNAMAGRFWTVDKRTESRIDCTDNLFLITLFRVRSDISAAVIVQTLLSRSERIVATHAILKSARVWKSCFLLWKVRMDIDEYVISSQAIRRKLFIPITARNGISLFSSFFPDEPAAIEPCDPS